MGATRGIPTWPRIPVIARWQQITKNAECGFCRLEPAKTKPTLVDKVFYRWQLTSQLSADLVPTHSVLARDTLTQLFCIENTC